MISIVAVFALLMGVALATVAMTRDDGDKWSDPKPATTSAPSGLKQFYDQKVSWSSCGSAKCAWIKVPVDYAKPDGATTRLRGRLRQDDGLELR